MIPQLLAVAAFAFFLTYLMPGDFITAQLHELPLSEIEAMRDVFGLDDPWPLQFIRWLGGLFRGDLGISLIHHRPVIEVIAGRVPNTFRLAVAQLILLYSIAIPFGILAGRYYRTWIDKSILLYGFIGLSLPAVVYGILLIFLFSFNLDVLPSRGSVDPIIYGTGTFFPIMISRLRHLVLPTLAGSTLSGVGIIYILRTQIIDGRSSDYATTARAKGIPESVIFRKHILRNSLIPFAQSIGMVFAGLFTGTLLLEILFSFPGMGELFFVSIMRQDTPVVSALIFIFAMLTALGVLIGDIALTIVDPRIRIR